MNINMQGCYSAVIHQYNNNGCLWQTYVLVVGVFNSNLVDINDLKHEL